MNFKTNSLKFTLGTKDICYFTKEIKKLSE